MALLVGIVVTVVASLRACVARATRVPPIAAVREGAELPPSRFARFRTPASAITTALGFAALLYALFRSGLGTTQVLLWLGVGALLVFIGVSLLSIRFIRPLAAVLGWPATRVGGVAGRLRATTRAATRSGTASTASALMIGSRS